MAVADALDLIVAPVGSAWDRVLAERPGIELYDTDGLHPSVEASYLRGVAAGIVLENASHWHLP